LAGVNIITGWEEYGFPVDLMLNKHLGGIWKTTGFDLIDGCRYVILGGSSIKFVKPF